MELLPDDLPDSKLVLLSTTPPACLGKLQGRVAARVAIKLSALLLPTPSTSQNRSRTFSEMMVSTPRSVYSSSSLKQLL